MGLTTSRSIAIKPLFHFLFLKKKTEYRNENMVVVVVVLLFFIYKKH